MQKSQIYRQHHKSVCNYILRTDPCIEETSPHLLFPTLNSFHEGDKYSHAGTVDDVLAAASTYNITTPIHQNYHTEPNHRDSRGHRHRPRRR